MTDSRSPTPPTAAELARMIAELLNDARILYLIDPNEGTSARIKTAESMLCAWGVHSANRNASPSGASPSPAATIRGGDVFQSPNMEALTVMRILPYGQAECRIQGESSRTGVLTIKDLRTFTYLGRAAHSDGRYAASEQLIRLAMTPPQAEP